MKNMDIGDIRAKQVIDIDDDKDQVQNSSMRQASDSQVQDQHASSSQEDKPNDQPSTSNEILQL